MEPLPPRRFQEALQTELLQKRAHEFGRLNEPRPADVRCRIEIHGDSIGALRVRHGRAPRVELNRTVLHCGQNAARGIQIEVLPFGRAQAVEQDRKSTRLNSSHGYISYAVFCLKKKKET